MSSLFAAFLGYNPVQQLLGAGLIHHLSAVQAAALTGRSFFPRLMTAPFSSALTEAFTFAFVACLVAAGASWLRGGKYHYQEKPGPADAHGASMPPAPAEQATVRR